MFKIDHYRVTPSVQELPGHKITIKSLRKDLDKSFFNLLIVILSRSFKMLKMDH